MKSIFQSLIAHLYDDYPDQAVNQIIQKRQKNGTCCINYLYGANIVARGLLSNSQSLYVEALMAGDFLFIDGIALQIITFFYQLIIHRQPKWYPNCNGTDLFPLLLGGLSRQGISFSLVLYGSRGEAVAQTNNFLSKRGYHILYSQDGFHPFNRQAYEESKKTLAPGTKIVFVQGRSTINRGIQEEWWYNEKNRCGQEGRLVCNQGGLFDHSSMGGSENRAPRWVQIMKAEWIRRLCINPQKNRKKVRYSIIVFPLVAREIIKTIRTSKANARKKQKKTNTV